MKIVFNTKGPGYIVKEGNNIIENIKSLDDVIIKYGRRIGLILHNEGFVEINCITNKK